MLNEKILAAVKTHFSKNGLKPATITKLVNIIETKVLAMGAIEDANLQSVIDAEVLLVEPVVGLIQVEVDARVRKPAPTPAPTPDDDDHTPDIDAAVAKAVEPFKKMLETLNEGISSKEKQEALKKRLATVSEILKAKGAEKEPVLQVTLQGFQIDESLTDDQIVEKVMPLYEANMKKFYGDSYVPPIPDGGKGKKPEEGLKTAQNFAQKAIQGLGILAPKKEE